MANLTESPIICWDKQGTLGLFSSDYSILRPGIDVLLEKLSGEGYLHIITTNEPTASARQNLEAAKLLRYFKDVYGSEHMIGKNKPYHLVAEIMGMTDEEARKRMIVVGDSDTDQPTDIEGMVFILNKTGIEAQANITGKILAALKTNGDIDFNRGFQHLEGTRNGHLTILESGIAFVQQYRNPQREVDSDNQFTPTITSIGLFP